MVIAENTIECSVVTEANAQEASGWSGSNVTISRGHVYDTIYPMAFWEAQTPSNQGEYSRVYTGIKDYSSSVNSSGLPQQILGGTTRLSGYIYLLKFYGNPGAWREPEIELYLDGARPSLSSASGAKIITKVWTDGQQGEDNDYFADHCDQVRVTIANNPQNKALGQYGLGTFYLTSLTTLEKALLKTCLGSSDFDLSNNVDVYNWDHGNINYPHLIKLVRTVTTYKDGGYYAALYYDPLQSLDNDPARTGTFILLNPFSPPDKLATDQYEIYTTKGTFGITSNQSEATFGFGSKFIYTTNTTNEINPTYQPYSGDISCNNIQANEGYVLNCLNTSDIFTMLSWNKPHYNPPHINLFTAKKITDLPYAQSVKTLFAAANPAAGFPNSVAFSLVDQQNKASKYLSHQITSDLSTNWGISVISQHPQFHVYKFFPAIPSTYTYVSQCSNRGLCDASGLGVCNCFPGYTSDSCSEQASLAL